MAITGLPIIAPASGDAQHRMSGLYIIVPANQAGIDSGAAEGTYVQDVLVFGGDGTDLYTFRVSGYGGKYSDIMLQRPEAHGLVLKQAWACQFSNITILRAKRHGIVLQAGGFGDSWGNQFSNVFLDRPSYTNSDIYNGIHITDGDNNRFDGVLFDGAVTHKNAVDFSGGTGNRLGAGTILPGITGTFVETTPGDNDLGLEQHIWITTGVLTTATGVIRLPILVSSELAYVEIMVNTAPTGATIVVDVNLNGTSVFPTATKPTIAIAGFTNIAIPDTTTLATGDYLTFDIDQVGSTIAGSDLTVVARFRSV